MVKEGESGKGCGEDDKLLRMQKLLGQMVKMQEQALQLPCPNCHSSLVRHDIGAVRCVCCDLVFSCHTLLESCNLKVED